MDNISIGKLIRRRRTDLNMTQAELAARLGVAAATINKYESGIVTNIPRSRLQQLSDALDIPVSDFFYYDTANAQTFDYLAPSEGQDNGIGYKIRRMRKLRGLTQEELGDRLGITKAAINKYESGAIKDYSGDRLKAMANALNVTYEYLLGLDKGEDANTEFAAAEQLIEKDKNNLYRLSISEKGVNIDTSLIDEYTEARGDILTSNERELIHIYRKLNLKQQTKILSLMFEYDEENAKLEEPLPKRTADLISHNIGRN